MPDYVRYDLINNRVKQLYESVDPSVVSGQNDILAYDENSTAQTIPQLRALFRAIPKKHLKHSGGIVVEMSAAEKAVVDAEIAAAEDAATRSGAKSFIAGFSAQPLLLRALADILKDEINIIRGWTVSFKAQVALATTLADLKVRVATLPTLSDRTLAQLRTAIQNRIDDRSVDN